MTKKTTLKEIGETLGFIVERMATKDDIARLDDRIDKLDGRIDKLEATVDRLDTRLIRFEENEIDKRKQLEVRVTAIEQHLGINKKIAG